MFQKVDVMGKLVDELMARTHELLQPNPGEYITVGSFGDIILQTDSDTGMTCAGLYDDTG